MDPVVGQLPAPAIARVLDGLAALKSALTPDMLLYHELERTEETLQRLLTLAHEAAVVPTTPDPPPP
jgi:hypothetical protein